MKIDRKEFKLWLKALRSGRYRQTEGTLQDGNGYCCLGVACKVLLPKSKLMLDQHTDYMFGGMPYDQTYAPEWLKDIDNDFNDRTHCSFPDLNDNKKLSFKKIANILDYVYLKSKKKTVNIDRFL